MRKLRPLLLALSGARSEVLDRCPTERIKFESLGWAILITSGMATVSMWFALSSAMGVNPFVAILAALGWGLVIMGIDRWLITSMPIDGKRRLGMAVPRLVLAILLGTLISTPLVLRIFQSEINAQISVIKQVRASAFLVQQQKSQVGQQVTYWTNQVSSLQKVIDSGGAAALNPSADPQVQSLTKQRSAQIALEQQYYHQWQCQLYGGQGCPAGNGPLAQASETNYHQAQAQVTQLTNQIQQRENQLSATDQASQTARYGQASAALPAAQAQLNSAVTRKDQLQQSFDAQNEATNGLLIRLQALDQLSTNDTTVSSARILLFLLFLVIECLPVTVKLMQQPGNYEKILQAERDHELTQARKMFRIRPRSMGGGFAGPGRLPEPDRSLHDIWQAKEPEPAGDVPTRAMPPQRDTHVPGRRAGATGDRPALRVTDTGEHTPLVDRALRGLDDDRVAATSDGHSGGIPLRWDDDDL